MGPSWVWAHQTHILKLIEDLKLRLFAQYTKGLALYDVPQGVERFHPPESAPSARVEGGMIELINGVAKRLDKVTIKLNHVVTSIKESGESLTVTTNQGDFQADKAISTLPPRLAQKLKFTPALPATITHKLKETPTWMGYSTKCVIEYKEPFWRDMGLSGFAFSHMGPLGEIHDATTSKSAALFGFLHTKHEADKTEIKKQLLRMYGPQAANFTAMHIVEWKNEPFTATAEDAKRLIDHPPYGFTLSHFNEKLLFSGSESAFKDGGYLEGAVISAMTIADAIKKR